MAPSNPESGIDPTAASALTASQEPEPVNVEPADAVWDPASHTQAAQKPLHQNGRIGAPQGMRSDSIDQQQERLQLDTATPSLHSPSSGRATSSLPLVNDTRNSEVSEQNLVIEQSARSHSNLAYTPKNEFEEAPSYVDINKPSSRTTSAIPTTRSGLSRSTSTNTNATSTISQSDADEPETQTLEDKNHRWYHYLTFKGKHIPPLPKERTHSPEHEAGFLSIITWHWIEPLMIKGYRRPLELMDIWTVNPNRTAQVMTEKLKENWEKRRRQPGSRQLLLALYDTFKFEFILGGICQFIVSIVQVLNPFILRYLIAFAGKAYEAALFPAKYQAPNIGNGIGLVFAVTILQFIQSGCTNQFLYRGMMNGGQARAVLISIIFDKAMTISGRAKAGGAPSASRLEVPAELSPGSKEEKKFLKKRLEAERKFAKASSGKKGVSGDGQGWTNGRILNLMSTDSYRVDQASGMFHMIWTSPISICITLVLLLININYSALAGFGLFVAATPILMQAIKSLYVRRTAISKITDQRVSLTQEILQAVRFVKYFGWEESFLERIESIRHREIRSIQFLLAIRNGINAISMSMPIFASMLAFITYSLTNHGLNPALIFSSLALFNSLRIPLNLLPLVLGQVVDAAASIARIQDFLNEEDAKDESDWNMDGRYAVEVQNASFTWERTPDKQEDKTKKQIREEKKEGQKVLKLREVEEKRIDEEKNAQQAISATDTSSSQDSDTWHGSGTELAEQPFHIDDINLSINRNELVAVIGGVGSGKSSLLAALAGDMRKSSGQVTLGASRAFCPQYAWIQNATVQENILFGRPMDAKWYNMVIEACALRPDLDMLPAGDQTEIGERGITVSGGQKQRLNIARAIYYNSDLVLMDDPLSAVDAHVGRHIMDQAICGLLQGKCRILATHQLWVLNRCDKIIWMQDGKICAFDTYNNLLASNSDFKVLIANNAQEEQKARGNEDENEVEQDKKMQKKMRKSKKQAALMQAEERAVSSVSWNVYKAYVNASGSWLIVPLLLLLLVTSQGAIIVTSLWLSWWTSDKFGYPRGVYIGIYAVLGFVQAILLFVFSIALSVAGTRSSKVMLHRAIKKVLRAPMSFFDTTPLGRITNRFSKDIDTMDNVITESIRFFLLTMGMIVSVFILIIAYYYYFAIALGPLMILFVLAAGFYRSSAREVKRHEAVLRSHVFARFSEAVNGTSTIRAYGNAPQFSKSIRDAIDEMNSAYFLTFANQRWLSVRLDLIGNLLVFVVGILVVTSRFSINPSTGGLVLSYILSIVQMIQFTVRQLAEVENNMNSTERIHYYGTMIDEEAPSHLPDRELSPGWPQQGQIEFKDVDMRYRAGLPLVLTSLNLKVEGGERIGIVGRTGAGKSSIMSTLFRLVELSGGSITIDGIDIATIGLNDLRSRLAIIPQDPTLFRGTVRSNLDPFNAYDDLQLWSALRQANLVGAEISSNGDGEAAAPEVDSHQAHSRRFDLDSPVEEEGLNFSLGQRQLMALARALVRNARIIVCDEATSSVDMQTDLQIQRTMATAFRGRTVLCIAHRLKTIISYDRIVVMDKGMVAEVGTPLQLWHQDGIFTSMCHRSKIVEADFEKAMLGLYE